MKLLLALCAMLAAGNAGAQTCPTGKVRANTPWGEECIPEQASCGFYGASAPPVGQRLPGCQWCEVGKNDKQMCFAVGERGQIVPAPVVGNALVVGQAVTLDEAKAKIITIPFSMWVDENGHPRPDWEHAMPDTFSNNVGSVPTLDEALRICERGKAALNGVVINPMSAERRPLCERVYDEQEKADVAALKAFVEHQK